MFALLMGTPELLAPVSFTGMYTNCPGVAVTVGTETVNVCPCDVRKPASNIRIAIVFFILYGFCFL
jgi:hypothetical protein